jgi:hypothetical protein
VTRCCRHRDEKPPPNSPSNLRPAAGIKVRLPVQSGVIGVMWETFGWVLDNPAWSGSIFAGVFLSVVFALPTPRRSWN